MSRFLANENVPSEAVALARQNGLDIVWMKERVPAARVTRRSLVLL